MGVGCICRLGLEGGGGLQRRGEGEKIKKGLDGERDEA